MIQALLWIVVVTMSGSIGREPIDLPALVARLDLTERGTARWLQQLGAGEGRAANERLLVVTLDGDLLLWRDGGRQSVVLGAALDSLLSRPGGALVLVHNHPSSTGLSPADLGQLAKPGVAAIVAIGHDGSVFAATAGPRMDRDRLQDGQVSAARRDLKRRLREGWGADGLPDGIRMPHLNHLVAQALARAGVVEYWFELRGASRDSYAIAPLGFAHAVAGAAAQLRGARTLLTSR